MKPASYNIQQLEAPESIEVRVYTQIRQAIMQGQLKPGERLVLDRLAATLGVSRVPVTQALKRLETQGFVSTTRRGETVVVELSATDAWELYVLRIRLQPLAARYAASRLQPDQLAEIEKLAETAASLRGAERTAVDRRFHQAIADASGMPRLIQILNNLWELTEVYRAAKDRQEQYLSVRATDNEDSRREHEILLDALRRGDGEAAESIERAHLVRITKLIFKVLGQSIPITESELNNLR